MFFITFGAKFPLNISKTVSGLGSYMIVYQTLQRGDCLIFSLTSWSSLCLVHHLIIAEN